MAALPAVLLLLAGLGGSLGAPGGSGPPKCPRGYFWATGFTPYNSFDQIADLLRYNAALGPFVDEAHARCSKFPVYAHDLNNFGARFYRLCLDKANNALYSFRTPNPCKGSPSNGTLFLGAVPKKCKDSQKQVVPNVWEQAAMSVNPPARLRPRPCPAGYRPADLPGDQALLKAFLSTYFTSSVYMAKMIDRFDNNIYCDDAFRYIGYRDMSGCLRRETTAKDRPQVLARGIVRWQCYAPPVGAGITRPIQKISLYVKGDYTMQCKPKIVFKWN